jgi:hypothetical protein
VWLRHLTCAVFCLSNTGVAGSNHAGGHICLSVASVVCWQVEVSASDWSLFQRSPTECGVPECDREASITRRPWPTRGCCAMEREGERERGEGIAALIFGRCRLVVPWLFPCNALDQASFAMVSSISVVTIELRLWVTPQLRFTRFPWVTGFSGLPGCHGYDRAWFVSDGTSRISVISIDPD